MIPVWLRISGFLSYNQPVELDFSSFDLACISGANGAGKSSLLDAITWALFGQARRRDDAIINSRAKAAEVRLDFLYEGSLYRIQRTKPRDKTTMLEFLVREEGENAAWRPLTEHTVRETELRIQSVLRLDYETFTNASFFLQGKADQFAQQRPSDRKRILSSILGLDAWETYRAAAAERRRAVENETAIYASQLNEIEEELKQEPERRARLAQLHASLEEASRQSLAQKSNLDRVRQISSALEEQRRLLELLRSGFETARQRAEPSASRLEERRAEQKAAAQQIADAVQVESAYQTWQNARVELQHWEQIAANFRQHESQRAAPLMKIESERSRLEQELTTLQTQSRNVNELAAQEEPMEKRLAELEMEIAEINLQLEERNNLDNQLADVQEQRAARSAENNRLFTEMTELKKRQRELQTEPEDLESQQTCPLCGQPLSPADRARLVDELEAQGKEMGDRHRANQSWLAQVETLRAQIQSRLNGLRDAENLLRQHQRQEDALRDRLGQMRQALADWERGGALRLRELERLLAEGRYALTARADLARVDRILKDLGYDAGQHDSVRAAEQVGRSSEEALRNLEAARASLVPLSREIKELEKHLASEQGEMEKQQAAVVQAEAQFAAASAGLPDLQQVENDLFMLQEQENRLRMQVGGATQAVEVYKTLRARMAAMQEERKALSLQIGQLKSLEQAFGKDGVPALLIEQALPEIEAQANEILDRLTAGNMSVRFATQKDYKDKNRDDKKETLDILISDSVGMREYELFSGGEAFRVNFAIRLALSRVLAQRAGARLQTLVIDEGFGSQDGEGRQRLVEAINKVRVDFAKVLVITHLEELKEAFPARIEVEKTLDGSQVKVMV
jgi:exonuclease SbcC